MKKYLINTATVSSLTAIIAFAAYALPSHSEEYIYFSDATYTQAVGHGTLHCNGHLSQSGQKTSFKKTMLSHPC
ncbi:DUF6289 family protein [Thalassotalea sp. PP2-459]|uniref:DUF6289 family protein n=1 Tax=Thalassotalea sp. PP2-459 TaxID=1742724 RepID=UPI000943ED96|nr:DUF6289 family protein [Thalassotalea sp. PP2-459]OKY27528.1 hypothetical protein BI291_08820 [Thalassotalea sp. PP2-459]